MRVRNIIMSFSLMAALSGGLTSALAASTASRAHLSLKGQSAENLCAAFGWQGVVDTDLDFSVFFKANHTIAARFMLQYPRAYQAPLLSMNGTGNYLVAVAGYGEGRTKAEKLLVTVGARTRYYTVTGKLAPERWHWLALVRDGSRLRLYLDGSLVKPDNSDDKIFGELLPVGTLRLGRKASGDAQFYGLIDDVAVFNSALSQKTLKSYYQDSPRLRGTEPGLVAAYLFDHTSDASPGAREEAARRRVSFSPTVTQVQVSSVRDSKLDASALPLPANRTKVLLPFAPGQEWKVIQGYGQELSHNDGGCFAWDFARVDGPSEEQPVYASAAGRVIAVSDNNDPEPTDDISKDNFNYLQMEIAPGEIVTYLHMKNGSLLEALKGLAPASLTGTLMPFQLSAGAQVGKVGNTWLKEQPRNWHLHFAGAPYVNSPVSIPLAISDYEVYDPQSKTWRRVERGVPQQNQIVRRAN